jgi:hypothetical protein
MGCGDMILTSKTSTPGCSGDVPNKERSEARAVSLKKRRRLYRKASFLGVHGRIILIRILQASGGQMGLINKWLRNGRRVSSGGLVPGNTVMGFSVNTTYRELLHKDALDTNTSQSM